MFPYIDRLGVQRRSPLPALYFDDVEAETPGFTAQSIAVQSSSTNARLRKRYASNIPAGQNAPYLLGAGLTPPTVTLTGRPTLGSYRVTIQITTGGPLGTALFRWSSDGGVTWTAGVTTAATVLLGSTGLTATFAAGTYDVSNIYAAEPPVPEQILGWLTILVSFDVLTRHGPNPKDPFYGGLAEDVMRVRTEMKEAADSDTGLFDLPISEDLGTAIDNPAVGGPYGCSQASPYEWVDIQARKIGLGGVWGTR